MRIIAGEFRGRRLLPPAGEQTRPVTDRAKQSIFDVLSPHLDGASVYDCFAGTGSFGLEALSRGASRATFFESHRPTLALLRRNIESLGVADRSTIISADWFAHLAHTRGDADVGIVFLDPPYRYLRERPDDLKRAVRSLADSHLAPGGLICFRHDAADSLSFDGFEPLNARTYGSMAFELLKRATPPE